MMQIAKGMLRRVDELGRVVIPKEIRGALKIECGSLLEFFVSPDGTIQLQKYQKLNEVNDFANICAKTFANIYQCKILVIDTEKILAVGNLSHKKYCNKKVPSIILDEIFNKKSNTINSEMLSKLFNEEDGGLGQGNIADIFLVNSNGDVYGAVIIIDDSTQKNVMHGIGKFVANILAEYLQ